MLRFVDRKNIAINLALIFELNQQKWFERSKRVKAAKARSKLKTNYLSKQIVGYWANSTECSDYGLKTHNFLSNLCQFFCVLYKKDLIERLERRHFWQS